MPQPQNFLNLLFPPRCLTCPAPVSAYGTLCAECWQQINFIANPLCELCGLPQDFDCGDGFLCAECQHRRPPFSRLRSVMEYNDFSRRLIIELKYQDETRLAAVFGPWLAAAGRELTETADLIVPVPLHYWRFVKRRYNQAALLAKALARHSSCAAMPDALIRVRGTSPQTGLRNRERERNVRGAFRVHPRHADSIRGKTVVLVDDVYTTGATLRACAKALLLSGAASVRAVTLARRL